MLPFCVFAAIHFRSVSSFPRLCDLRDFCVEIPLSFDSHCYTAPNTSAKLAQKNSFQISALRTLSFSVSRKSCICHSYENCRVCTNNSHSGTRHAPFPAPASKLQGLTSVFSHSCALFCTFLHSSKTQLFCFQAIPHSLPKTTRGGDTPNVPTSVAIPNPNTRTSLLLSFLSPPSRPVTATPPWSDTRQRRHSSR